MAANEAAYGVPDNRAQDTHRAVDAERVCRLAWLSPKLSPIAICSHRLVALVRMVYLAGFGLKA
jgi:hypothetical protein